jgi:hypothetical protein
MPKLFYALWVTALVSSIALQAAPHEMTAVQIAGFVGASSCNATNYASSNCSFSCTQIKWVYSAGPNGTLSCTSGTGNQCSDAKCSANLQLNGCSSCCGS